ncbi:MAG: efflux RND transporter periplasmic adaptor subunit [Chloroflexota bacterium]
MKRNLWILLLIFSLALSACGQLAATPLPTVALDAPVNGSSSTSTEAVASGEIVPAQIVRLSFPLTGVITAVNVAEGDKVTAGQVVAQLDTTILAAQVAQARASLSTAELQVKYLKRVGTSQEYLDSAIADVDRLTAALQAAEAQVALATLTAPISATVISVDAAPAEVATPGRVIITLADLGSFQVETTDMSERDILKVHVGAPVTVFIEALEQEFSGTVVDIARVSETVGGDVVFRVTVELDEQPAGLRWGMSTEVRVQGGE